MAVLIVLSGLTTAVEKAQSAPDARDSWPTFAYDGYRSAVTKMELELPLSLAWSHASGSTPTPAWPPPAKHDHWHNKHGLNPRVTFDHAYQVTAANGRVYFGSSGDDRIVCLNARTGTLRWSFFTQGPVRLAPTIHGNHVLAGSDDGYLYCLNADDGEVVWKSRPGPSDSQCIGNGRLISRWPIRSGVLVKDNIAYCAAGLFPHSEGVHLAGYNTATGEEVLNKKIDQSVQGYIASSGDQLFLMSGRTAPGVFDRRNGKRVGSIDGSGGAFAVLANDVMATGPGDADGHLAITDPTSKNQLLSFPGLHLIADQEQLVVHSRDSLRALNRAKFLALAARHFQLRQLLNKLEKQKASKDEQAETKLELANVAKQLEGTQIWRVPCDCAESLILAGDKIIAGGLGKVRAFSASDGSLLWTESVDGRACGLAAAEGRLLVSNDKGTVYCFAPKNTAAAVKPGPSQVTSDTNGGTRTPNTPTSARPRKGFSLLIDSDLPTAGRPELDRFLKSLPNYHTVIHCGNEDEAEMIRQSAIALGIYGSRVVVHHGLTQLNTYPPYFANQVTISSWPISGEPNQSIASILRLVRPCGGTVHFRGAALAKLSQQAESGNTELLEEIKRQGFAVRRQEKDGVAVIVAKRSPLPNAGEWTHGLADPANSACSGDLLAHGPMRIQWFGRPGPRPMADRHHRAVPPLYKAGRLFIPGENQVIVVDAYNGTELWRREIPNSLRLGAFLDCSNMMVDDRSFYLAAEDTCHEFDSGTGEPLRELKVPQLNDERNMQWGYLARTKDLIVGSAREREATYWRQSRDADLALWYDNMAMVTSRAVFALNVESGKPAWIHQSGIVINTTITIGGGRIYFLENESPKAIENTRGRMPMSTFFDGPNHLIALDLETGKQVWQQPVDLSDCRHIVYLNYGSEKLVLSGNRYVKSRLWYFFSGIDATSGKTVWNASHNSGYRPNGDHGEQNRHPTIVNDEIYTYPYAYKLHSGERIEDWKFDRMGHGCGNVSASAGSIYWRGGNPWQCDLDGKWTPRPVNNVTRPGCFINILPAGGMLLIPEASSGCTCGFALQTSLAYVPEKLVN